MKISLGPLGVLAIVFITLKLCAVINWSWWWALAPLWGPFALIAALVITIGPVWFFVAAIRNARRMARS